MVLINPTLKEIVVKIVYYGPGLGGKTTNLKFIYEHIDPSTRGKIISLSTEGDRTLFFDFLPLKLGKIGDYNVRIQLYTVPGQVFYEATRKLVLNGADGVVFVADSQKSVLDSNYESLESLKNNLREKGIKIEEIPLVFQFNKRDLKDIHDINFLNRELNELGRPYFPAIAIRGDGVMETFNKISELVIKSISHRIDREGSFKTSPISVPKVSSPEEKTFVEAKPLIKETQKKPLSKELLEENVEIQTLKPIDDSEVAVKKESKEINIPIEIELKDKESAKFEIKISLTVRRKE